MLTQTQLNTTDPFAIRLGISMETSRQCNSCKVDKPLEDYHNCSRFPLGKTYTCKPCAREKSLRWGQENKEKKRLNNRRHYEKDKERYLERARNSTWSKDNRERVNMLTRKRYWKNRQELVAKLAEKRAKKFLATPPWLTESLKKDIVAVYQLAHTLTKQTGIPHHVDHIIPLNSPLVCGLHVPWNLRAIPAKENASKSNKLLEELI